MAIPNTNDPLHYSTIDQRLALNWHREPHRSHTFPHTFARTSEPCLKGRLRFWLDEHCDDVFMAPTREAFVLYFKSAEDRAKFVEGFE